MIQIGQNAWQIPVLPRQSVNCYLLGDVLIDAGARWSGNTLLKALRGKALSAHALTHAHPDHQGASATICKALGVPLWCHGAEKEAAETGFVLGSFPNQNSMLAKMQQRFLAGPGHPVARVLAAGDTVADFEVIETPGHTAGHISFWRSEDGLLIAGDAAVGMNLVTSASGLGLPLSVATWDMDRARDSIRALATLNPRRVAFGHGPVASGEAFREFAAGLG